MNGQIKHIFSSLHASDETLKEVLDLIDRNENQKMKRKSFRPMYVILAASIAFSMLVLTGFTADYVLNGREVFFFDTISALAEKQSEDALGTAVHLGIPGSLEENRDLETPQEYTARVMKNGIRENETVLIQETDNDPATVWEERRVSEQDHDHYGAITSEYMVGEAFAERIVIAGLTDFDVSCIGKVLTPTENAQLIVTERSRESGKIVMAAVNLGYHNEKGEILSFNLNYDRDERFSTAQYILNDTYDSIELYQTSDHVKVLISSYDGQVWATAGNKGMDVSIYTTACSVTEMKELLDALQLSHAIR